MGVFGVDYSTGRPSPAALRAAGVRYVVRYVSPGDNPKNLSREEAQALWDAGILTVLVFESYETRALSGYNAGVTDAQTALAKAGSVGAPHDCVIYFAVDFDVTDAQTDAVSQYVRGVEHVLGYARTGVYGGYNLIRRAFMEGWCRHFWQTYAWSHGLWHSAAGLRQYSNGHWLGGANVDYDTAVTDYIGQFGAHGVVTTWEANELDATQAVMLEDAYNILVGLANGQESVAAHDKDGVRDLTPFYQEIVTRLGQALPAQTVQAQLSAQDRAAIVADVLAAIRADLSSMLAAVTVGKEPAPDGAVVSGG